MPELAEVAFAWEVESGIGKFIKTGYATHHRGFIVIFYQEM